MKLKDAQLISKYTTLKKDKLYYEGIAVDSIPLAAWEKWMNNEIDAEKKTFFSMMLQRALKQKKTP